MRRENPPGAQRLNLTATTDPGASNDNTQGYVVGSRWINVSTDEEFVCLDSSTGAAVWQSTTSGGGASDHGALTGLADDDHTQYLRADGTRTLAGNLTITGTVDGRDVAADGTKLDGIETGATADQVASEVPFTPTGDVAATDVQAAIAELDAEKAATGHAHANASASGAGFLPQSNFAATINPGSTDDTNAGYAVGSVWVNTAGQSVWVCRDATASAALWDRVDNVLGSVFGRTGAVTAQASDYDADQVDFTPTGGISATDVQAAIAELDTEKAATAHTIASHSDTTATGAELEELTDGSTTTLHNHAHSNEGEGEGLHAVTSPTARGFFPRSNFAALADPTVNDDNGDGYQVGSLWVNTSSDAVFQCADASSAAAVWQRLDNVAGGTSQINVQEEGTTVATEDTVNFVSPFITVSDGGSRADVTGPNAGVTPASVGTANAEGASTSVARADHVHAHGAQTDGTLHALANASAAGFLPQSNLAASTDPTAGDDTGDGYVVGSLWINTTADTAWICLDATAAAAVWTEITQSGGGASDHGALTGLADDDHTQYLLVDGTRAMTGALDMGAQAIEDRAFNVITEALGASTNNNWSPTNWSTADEIRVNATGSVVFTGFDATATTRVKRLRNVGSGTITIRDQDAGSDAANRCDCPISQDISVRNNETVLLVRDATDSRWSVAVFSHLKGPNFSTTANALAVFSNTTGGLIEDRPDIIATFAGDLGIGGTPTADAQLDLQKTDGALYLPRLTTAQRDGLTAQNGFMIFNTTTAQVEVREGGAWAAVTGSGVSDHGALTGLADDDHTQYLLADGTRTLAGNLTVTGTVDGRDVAADGTKLDGIETAADVTDAANVAAAGAVMDSDIAEGEGMLRKTGVGAYEAIQTNLGASTNPTTSNDNTEGYAVGSLWINTAGDAVWQCVDASTGAAVWRRADITDHGEMAGLGDDDHAQYLLADGTRTLGGNLTVTGTVDGRDVAADGTKLDGIETAADVTDAANVAAAGAVMDSDIAQAEGLIRKTGAGTYEAIQTNLNATTDPGVSDDSGSGYAVGSIWINTTSDEAFVCLDASVGAAVWTSITAAAAASDHGGLTGLTDDDHTQYAQLAGRTGGQTLQGGTASGNNLTLESTSNATKGRVITLDDAEFRGAVKVGASGAPGTSMALDVDSTTGGLMPPRMTTTQRNALTAAAGMAIWNTTTGTLEVYDGSAWQDALGGGGASFDQRKIIVWDDFMWNSSANALGWVRSFTGTGANMRPEAIDGWYGMCEFDAGNAGGRAALSRGNSDPGTNQIQGLDATAGPHNGQPVLIETVIMFPTGSGVGTDFWDHILIGFGDNFQQGTASNIDDFIGIEYDPGENAQFAVRLSNGGTTTRSAGTTSPAVNTVYRVGVLVDPNGGSPQASLYVNGTQEGSTISTNFPGGDLQVGIRCIGSGVDASEAHMDMDYIYVAFNGDPEAGARA